MDEIRQQTVPGKDNDNAIAQSGTPSPKRSVSSGLFSRFNFLRPAEQDGEYVSSDAPPPKSKTSIDDERAEIRAETLQRRTSVSDVSRSATVKQRKRKGSLRKSALLGGRKFGAESKDKKSLLSQSSAQEHGIDTSILRQAEQEQEIAGLGIEVSTKPRPFMIESASSSRSSFVAVSTVSDGGTMHSIVDSVPSTSMPSTSSTQKRSDQDTSTTEEDDYASLARSGKSAIPRVGSQASFLSSVDAASSYFPPQSLLHKRSSQRLRPSPLQQSLAPPPEHSYAETEYWGWVILFGTWLLFTVGMGSCLDIWSWAWDVGETPYAPPELEDDPTLPIVGYYPALIVLTGVVAWIWITVAWVGMKYFRHAKIEV